MKYSALGSPGRGRGGPSRTFLSVQPPAPGAPCTSPILISASGLTCVFAFRSSDPTCVPGVFLGVWGLLASMPASLSVTLGPARKLRAASTWGILGTWTCVALFCFALQSARGLSNEDTRNCDEEMPCAEEKPGQPGCPEGGLCPSSPPAPCPPGTFLLGEGTHNASSCHLCPRGFFNPWPGQDACFPCGTGAAQPEEGQVTCMCSGPGRVFQPSDSQCPCLPGYQDVGEPRGCVRQEHEPCKDGATRNQDGLCLTKEQWGAHCAHEVCATAGDARGYDPGLGLCLCREQPSRGTCGPLCPEDQRQGLQLSCPEGVPQISVPEDAGSQDFDLPDSLSSPRAVGHPCHLDHSRKTVPLYVVRMDGGKCTEAWLRFRKPMDGFCCVHTPATLSPRDLPGFRDILLVLESGFLGLTRPGSDLLRSLRLPLRGAQLPGQDAGRSQEGQLPSPWPLDFNSTHPGNLSCLEPGIRNPTVCLQINDVLAFLVTRKHYPEYDLGHFYNTAVDFDWGRFRALAEEFRLHHPRPRLFLQQFLQPGVYVFRLSSNPHRRMYLRTLPLGGRCFAEGPFASTTPRHLMQTGIAKVPKPLKRSDWPAVLGGIALLLGLCLLLLIQCHSLSWARKVAPTPIFREHQQAYNLHAYASPKTRMTLVRKGQLHQDSDTPRVEGESGLAEEQVDLEGFDTESFFRILRRQSLSVTNKLSQTKEELKVLYLKLVSEAHALRQLWGPHRTPTRTEQLLGSTRSKEQQIAETVARAAEDEARRRQRLAAQYAASLRHQLELLRQDLGARREQWASFFSALTAAQRLLKAQEGSGPATSSLGGQTPQGEMSQLDTLIGHLSQSVLQEGHRLKAWGVLGTGTGAELLRPASAGPQGGAEDISVNPITKLLVPGPSCTMLPASGHAGAIPPGHFLHPATGRLLPEAGNLGYDLQEATLVPTTDFGAGGVRTSEAAILPYVPYPICPATGSPPATRLPPLQPRRTSQLGALMTDPRTGMEVPVLAVTLHPETRQWLTLGGTYCNPLTKTLAPLELGGPWEDPATGGLSPVLGVGLDENTGHVVALGGLRDAAGNLLLPGDSFAETLSGKTARLQGASRLGGRTLPHAGGPEALLDANVLAAQRRVVAALRQGQERPGPPAQGRLAAAVKDMRRALALSLHHVLQRTRRLDRQLEAATAVEASGGKLGMARYPGTELWIPVLYGMEMPDPEGSGLSVPILGLETCGHSGDAILLAGSMEDASGKGLVPISIGAQAVDLLTGEPGPVIGAHTEPSSRVVVPVVQVLEALPRGVRDPELLDSLDREQRARDQYWHRQEEAEEQLAELLVALSQELLCQPGRSLVQQLRALKEACETLESRCLQEAERRARALSTHCGPERRLLWQADRAEWELEAQVALGVRKVLQTLGQSAEKLRRIAGRLQSQEQMLQSQNPQSQSWSQKVVQHLSAEFQEVVRERQSFLEKARGQLQYQRELSRLQLLHTQVVASGTPVCLENYPGHRFYGPVTSSPRGEATAYPGLIPFLKSLTAALEGTQGRGLDLEGWRPGAEVDEADIMWLSSLFSTLKKRDAWPCVHKEEAELLPKRKQGPDSKSSLQDLPKSQTMQKDKLLTVQPTDLSAREFVIYQYGLSILNLLIPQLPAPKITLQIASHLPATEVSDNIFHGSFFYKSAENTLFIVRESLASVGSFVLLLIHCLAHITAKDQHQDSTPAFLRFFYKGLKVYFSEAFSITLRMSAISWDSKLDQSISAILLEEQPVSERGLDLLSKLIETKHGSPLAPESSEEYIKKNKDLLLFTNMEHFLKSILAAELQIPRDQSGEKDMM